jgi:hypothetical protein
MVGCGEGQAAAARLTAQVLISLGSGIALLVPLLAVCAPFFVRIIARLQLLQTPFADYEYTLRADLHRALAGTDFDFDRDVTAIYVYRWGHGMVMPTLGFPFGTPTV